MNSKCNKLKRICSLLLATIMLVISLPIESLANNDNKVSAGSTNIGNGSCKPGDGSGGAHLVFITTIPNTVLNDADRFTKPEYLDANNKYIGDIGATLINSYRNKADMQNIFTPDAMRSATFYPRAGWNNYTPNSLCLNIMSGSGIELKMYPQDPNNPYTPADGYPYGPYQPRATYTPNWWDKDPETYTAYYQMMNGKYPDVDFKWSETPTEEMADKYIYEIFTKESLLWNAANALSKWIYTMYGTQQAAISSDFLTYCTPTKAAGSTDVGYALAWLTAVVLESERQHNAAYGSPQKDNDPGYTWKNEAGRKALKSYFLNRNKDGSPEFVIVADIAVAGQHDSASGRVAHAYSYVAALNNGGVSISWDSLSSWLAEKYTSLSSTYQGGYTTGPIRDREIDDNNLIRQKSGFSGVAEGIVWMHHYFSNWRIKKGAGSGMLKYTGMSTGYWTEEVGWESSVRMVDAKGNILGVPGIGYFGAYGGMPNHEETDHSSGDGCETDDCTPPGDQPSAPDVSISVDPHSKKVETECADDNVITVNIKSNINTSKLSEIYSYWENNFKSKDPNAYIQIIYSLGDKVIEGDPGDTQFYNVLSKGSGDFTATNNNHTLTSSKITSLAELKDFLSGSKSQVTLQDTQIKVCDTVTLKYIVSMYVCMRGGGKHEDIRANPKGTIVGSDGSCSDKATLYTSDKPYYYSTMRHKPVSEIKADAPYGETYEAMAGVPTTTNIYLGTGATEYMVNVDLEYKVTEGERTYTFKVTETNCYGDNEACTYSPCPGPVYDDKGQVTHAKHTKSCPYLGTVVADSITDHRNDKHPGTCNYTYTIKQKIEPIHYMDITKEDLYRLVDFQLAGNSKLQNPNRITLNPNIGYYSFHDQEGYSNNNGRFRFSISLPNDSEHWGNTLKSIGSQSVNATHDTCKQKACDAINAVVKTLTNNTVTVVSDYVVLETSEGYQNVMYYELTSNNVPLNGMTVSPGDFGDHADMSTSNLTCEKDAPNLTWPKDPTQEEMWDNNGNSSAKWSTTHITTTGYNGDYEDVKGKYDNSNSTRSSNIAKQNVTWNQPNLKKIEGDTDFQDGVNSRYIKTGINILDSTTPPPERKWSASDSISPVTNGEWDTGHCTVLYKKEVSYKNSPGQKWDQWCRRREAPYSEEHDKINNIVIHNPISNRDAVVISNEKKYDQRYWGDLDPVRPPTDDQKCPRDATCAYSILTCRQSTPHTAACYKTVSIGYGCGGKPFNTHVHDSNCGNWSYETGKKHVTRCVHKNHRYDGDWWVQDDNDHCVCGHGGCRFVRLETDGQTTQGAAYYIITGNERSFKCTDGVSRFVVADPGNELNAKIYKGHDIKLVIHDGSCSFGGSEYETKGFHHLYDMTDGKCLTCDHDCGYSVKATLDINALICDNVPNTHVHTNACMKYGQVLSCTDPHHYVPNSEPHDVNSPSCHYPFADRRCYTPCNNDANHRAPAQIQIPGGQLSSTTDVFINIDREFKIYYPDVGDFEQQPRLNGISECVSEKGLGYKNNTDTDKWLRNKFVIYPFNTIDAANNTWGYGEPIDLLKLPDKNKVYKFECLLANSEHNACAVYFHSVANNAPEQYTYDDATSHTNFERYSNHAAKMSVTKKQDIDVVGSIGALTIHDTGDPRFAELFKKPLNNGKWLIPNVVKEVDYALPNMIVADDKDSRNEDCTTTGYYHSPYGVTNMATGGKNHPYIKLPLVPYKNPNTELQHEEMRPGYNLYMDIETIGDYYGENYRKDTGDVLVPWERGADATGMFTYKMQIKPKYWELDLDSKQWHEVDCYMQSGSTYLPIVLTNKSNQTSEYYYYLDWLNESARRSYSPQESKMNTGYQTSISNEFYHLRLPTSDRDVIGSTDRIYLIDIDRTFIGSSTRYGRDMNTGNPRYEVTDDRIDSEYSYLSQSQRWHWTLGLPSSTVFVRAGEECNDRNIKAFRSRNSVVVCTMDIKVRGSVWTLNYDGTAVNYSDGGGFKIYPGGPTYTPPTDPNTGKVIDDPIITIYNNKRTSKDDIQTQGTH